MNKKVIITIVAVILVCGLVFLISNLIKHGAKEAELNEIVQEAENEVQFNAKFNKYQGIRQGKELKDLFGDLIANAKENDGKRTRIPTVIIGRYGINEAGDKEFSYIKYESQEQYKEGMRELANLMDQKHSYNVILTKKSNLVTYITINYNEKDTATCDFLLNK